MAKISLFIKLLFVFIALILSIVILSNKYLTVTDYEVNIKNLPSDFENYKIALITDLHSSSFGKESKALLKKLKKEKPDIVLLGGDMISTTDIDYSVFFGLAKELARVYPTYYIFGNHEQALEEKKLNYLCQSIKATGVEILDNEKVALKKGSHTINLYGMWFNLRFYVDRSESISSQSQYYFDIDTMKDVIGQKEKGVNILLTHNPVYFDTYEKWGADLTLSGHIHGGMVRLPFLGGVCSPEKTFFPLYDSGLFKINNSQMIVSRGLGNGDLGFRFLNYPELVIVTLKNKIS